MGYKIIYSAIALEDLISIRRYISTNLMVPDIAKGQTDRITKEIKTLSDLPERFKVLDWKPWKSIGVRRLSVDNYAVFYLIDKKAAIINIIRIVYAGRDIDDILKDV